MNMKKRIFLPVLLCLLAAALPAQTLAAGLPLLRGGASAVVWPRSGQPVLSVFATGADGRLLEGREGAGAWAWTDHGQPPKSRLATSPAGVSWPEGSVTRLNVFGLGIDGHLVERWWNGTTWAWSDHGLPPAAQPPRPLEGRPVTDAESPAAVTWLAGDGAARRLNLYVKSLDGRLIERSWDGARWSWRDHGWPGGGRAASRPFAVVWERFSATVESSTVRLSVFAVGQDGHLVERLWNGSAWSWTDHGRAPGDEPFTGIPSGFAWKQGRTPRLNVFCRAGAGHLIERWWDGSAWRWTDHGVPPGAGNGPLAAGSVAVTWVVSGSDRFSLFFPAPNSLFERHWDGARWIWTDHPAPRGSRLESGFLPGAAVWAAAGRPFWSAFVVRRDGSLLERSAGVQGASWNDQRGPASAPDRPNRVEVASSRPIDQDPVLRGLPFNPTALPPAKPPGEFKDPAFRRRMGLMKWQSPARFSLAPGRTRRITIAASEPSWITATINWSGSGGPVSLAILQGNTTLAQGNPTPLPPSRGAADAAARLQRAGNVVVTITNRSQRRVSIEAVVGTFPLSARR